MIYSFFLIAQLNFKKILLTLTESRCVISWHYDKKAVGKILYEYPRFSQILHNEWIRWLNKNEEC